MNTFSIKLVTYNVGDKSADDISPKEMFNFIEQKKFDFIFIGLQEVVSDATWTSCIKKHCQGHDYVIMKVRNIWAMWLYAIAKRSVLTKIDDIESEVTASGYAGVMANKGGVSIRFKYEGINVAVVNAHFTAHEEGLKDRLNDYLDIVSNQSFRDRDVGSLLDHDFLFWLGDLNFRIDDISKQEVERLVKEKRFADIFAHDQLQKAIKDHKIFKDFKEGEITFPPTFKYDDHCDVYDTSKKQRKPAWTDRILYLHYTDDPVSRPEIKMLKYYHEPNERGSDHRPVCAEFCISFKPLTCPPLPIEFTDVKGVWNGEHDVKVWYKCVVPIPEPDEDLTNRKALSIFRPDKWDWIALVPQDWTLLSEDLITYVYAPTADEHHIHKPVEVEFSKRYLAAVPKHKGLQLVYFSKRKNCIQGYSNVFQSS